MSEPVQRQPVNDPLAITGREQRTERSVQGGYVGQPNNGSISDFIRGTEGLQQAFAGFSGAVNDLLDTKRTEAITEGKTAFMAGMTEQEMLKNGDRFFQQGWKTLDTKDKMNTWFSEESIALDQTGKTMTPEGYRQYMMDRRKQLLAGITDPDQKRVAEAAMEEFSPRLASEHMVKHSEYNVQQAGSKLSAALYSGSSIDPNRSVQDDVVGIPLAPTPVEAIVKYSPEDRDLGIRTLLGEAAGEGSDGMAAVAHVLRNRMTDSRFPSSIRDVALQPKQFSTWNNGEGGNQESFRGIGPGNPLYEKAGRVWDAVMSGRHVDPTHGATHYYAPDQADPAWVDQEARGNKVRIGGHEFIGRSDAKRSASAGEIRFTGNADPRLNDDLKNVLSYASGTMGVPLTVQSGYRSPERNAAVGGAKASEHMHGNAADISMAGMNEQQRQQLVRSLQAGGAKRFITYSNSPDMLHVDLKDVPAGQSAFMYDKSKDNMQNAPEWFKQLSAEPSSVAAPAKGTSTQNFLLTLNQSTVPDDVKATALSDAIRRQLDEGSNQLFTDAGGVGMLYKLGAKPAEIDEVLRAQERFKMKQLNKFNADQVKFQDDIMARAGKLEDRETILKDIEAKVKSGEMDDNDARALAASALSTIRAEREQQDKAKAAADKAAADKFTTLTNPNMLNELGGVYQQIKHDPNFDVMKAQEKAVAIAKRYGATEQDIGKIVTKMFDLDQARKDGLIKKSEEVSKKAAKDKEVLDKVATVKSQHWGGQNLEGSVNGVPAKKLLVDSVKADYANKWTEAANAGQVSQAEAKTSMLRDTYKELRQHGVIDEEFRAHTEGALLHGILGKDGKITESALQAYDAYRALRQTDPQMEYYLAQTITNPDVRRFLEIANTLDDGNLNQEQAMLKAHEIVNDKTRDPNAALKHDGWFEATRDQSIKEVLDDKSYQGFIATAFGTGDIYAQQRASSFENKARAANFIAAQADSYFLQNPYDTPEAIMKMAKQNLANASHLVMGNLLIGEPGKPLSKFLFPKDTNLSDDDAKSAMEMFLRDHGETLWKQNWSDRKESYTSAAFNAGPGRPANPKMPDVNMVLDAQHGTIMVDLYKDDKLRELVHQPVVLDLAQVGEYYKSKTKAQEPTTTDKMFNELFGKLGRGTKSLDDYAKTQADGYEQPGAAIGRMIKQ